MRKAIEAIQRNEMGYKKASISFSVPKSTLEDRVKKVKAGGTLEEASCKGKSNLFGT